MVRKYNIIDTTLREGEQTPGVLFSLDQKKRIIDGLVQIGVTEIELGISSMLHTCVKPLIAYCRSYYPHLILSLWCRCQAEDITHAAEVRPDILSLSIPVSDIHLRDRLKKNRDWAFDKMCFSIKAAKKLGLRVAIGFEDATRSNTVFLEKMVNAAALHGVERIRLADTVGISSPAQITDLVSSLISKNTGCTIGVHTHNDFGMATANGVAALEAGAQTVDAVVLGLGERTGCARLEELAGYLNIAKGCKAFKIEHLKPLANYVAEISGRSIAGNHPIVGKDIFNCESGLHLQGLQNHPPSYEPFDPKLVQAERKFLYGAKSGRSAILSHMASLNQGKPVHFDKSAVQNVRNTAAKLGRPLNDTELTALLMPLQ